MSLNKAAQTNPIYTLIPDHEAIALVAYYREFVEYYPECELQTKRWFVENIQDDWVIFDVGANIGYYSVLFSRLAKNGRIYAFEPTETVDLLRKNIEYNNARNVEALKLAVGAISGEHIENIYRIWGKDPERRAYKFETIDSMMEKLALERLDCIKIDVDSFDFDVLRGAKNTLERLNPWVVVELNHALAKRNQSTSAALEWLVGRGYQKAFVTDHENFILRRDCDTEGATNASGIELSFDQRPLFMPSQFTEDVRLTNLPFSDYRQYNAADVKFDRDSGYLHVTVPGPTWSYALSWAMPVSAKTSGAILVEVSLRVLDGSVGLGCVSGDESHYCSEETTVAPIGALQTATIFIPDPSSAEHLILRNADAAGNVALVCITSIVISRAKPRTIEGSPLLSPKRTRLLLAECDCVLKGEDIGKWRGEIESGAIDVVPITELHRAFGFPRPFVPEIKVYRHTLAEFKTQIDESAIFSYIYGQAKPKRHLEFGTWEGFGVVLCAKSSDAEIWTINLPHGETDAAGNALYTCNNFDGAYTETQLAAAANGATDAGPFIGWRYRAAGYVNRVHQILCDSRDFDEFAFDAGFFDTVLIDGGHTAEVVQSDTDKALPLLRSGGIIIWHDFCPDPQTVRLNEAPRGVIRAVVDNFDRWRPNLSKFFWIQPSWMLVGIKA